MWSIKIFSIFIWLVAVKSEVKQRNGNIVCYYVSENGYSRAPPEILNPNLCTHAIYAFADIDSDGFIKIRNEDLDLRNKMYERFVALRNGNPDLKVLVSVLSTASIYSAVAADAWKRRNFAISTRIFLEVYGFDGIDVDWEKPYAKDRDNFVQLLKELRHELNNTGLITSIAVYPMCSEEYNAPELSKYVDLINVMTYNFFGPWSKRTGQNSGLYASSMDSAYERKYLNTNASILGWIGAGSPRNKLMMGIPFYGRSFTLKDRDQHGVHAAITGSGNVPTPTYSQLYSLYANWTEVWDDEQKNYYRYGDNQWVGYEEERSVRDKVSYAISQQLGGVMIWHLGADDVRGAIGHKQGLLEAINDAFRTTTRPSS